MLALGTLGIFWKPHMSGWRAPVFFSPTTLVDGFSKLWLRGKGNLGVEALILAGSWPPRAWPVLSPQNPVLGGCHVPSSILHKIGDLVPEMPKTKNNGICYCLRFPDLEHYSDIRMHNHPKRLKLRPSYAQITKKGTIL